MKQYAIPSISNEVLYKRAKHCRPLVERNGKFRLGYCELNETLRTTSFPWSRWYGNRVRRSKLHKIITHETLHKFGHPMLFKPSVAEVLAQLPPEIEDYLLVRAETDFEEGYGIVFFVEGPEDAEALNVQHEARDAGFHVAQTTFYKLEDRNIDLRTL